VTEAEAEKRDEPEAIASDDWDTSIVTQVQAETNVVTLSRHCEDTEEDKEEDKEGKEEEKNEEKEVEKKETEEREGDTEEEEKDMEEREENDENVPQPAGGADKDLFETVAELGAASSSLDDPKNEAGPDKEEEEEEEEEEEQQKQKVSADAEECLQDDIDGF